MSRQLKHILITGAAGAIASAITQILAQRYPQAHFTLIDINEQALQQRVQALGNRASYALWDLFKPEQLAEQWQKITQNKPVDLLVNCAGIMDIISFQGTGWQLGWKLLSVNLISPLRLMDLALADMPAGGGIINIASMAGRVPITGCAYYSGAKAGMAMASEIADNELKERNIHVLTVYPGPIFSDLEAHARGQVKQGMVSKLIPTGQAQDIAQEIVDSFQRKKVRVIYPKAYAVAHYFNAVSQWFVAAFSPKPLK